MKSSSEFIDDLKVRIDRIKHLSQDCGVEFPLEIEENLQEIQENLHEVNQQCEKSPETPELDIEKIKKKNIALRELAHSRIKELKKVRKDRLQNPQHSIRNLKESLGSLIDDSLTIKKELNRLHDFEGTSVHENLYDFKQEITDIHKELRDRLEITRRVDEENQFLKQSVHDLSFQLESLQAKQTTCSCALF